MKMIVTYIRSEQLPAVKEALSDAGFHSLSAMPVLGTAPKSEQRMFRGVPLDVSLFRRVRLELALRDEQVEKAIEAICAGAKESGGYGRIFVTELHDAVKIWTDERGEAAL